MRTGLPFHVDGPFFVEKKGRKAFLVDNGKISNTVLYLAIEKNSCSLGIKSFACVVFFFDSKKAVDYGSDVFLWVRFLKWRSLPPLNLTLPPISKRTTRFSRKTLAALRWCGCRRVEQRALRDPVHRPRAGSPV